MKRVKAYTLMEMTIAMLLAGIVIMITYTIYTIVLRAYNTSNERNVEVAEQLRLDELLKKDFANSTAIIRTDSGMVCKTGSRVIVYQIQPGLVIRTYGITDTFRVQLEDNVFSFEKKVINESKDSTTIDELRLDLRFRNNLNRYYYRKHYSAAELLKFYDYAIN